MKKKIRLLSWLLALLMIIQIPLTAIADDSSTETSTSVTAKVSQTNESYRVKFPDTISLGKITEVQDITITYTVTITMKNTEGGTLRVSVPSTGYFYLNGDDTSDALEYTNSFGTRDFTESTTVTATITVKAEDVAKVSRGNYSGSISYSTTYYEAGTTPSDSEDQDQEETSTETKTVHFMQSSDISKTSMCDPLIYSQAQLTDNGDGTTTVTFYCIDPVPGYSTYGKPIDTFIACGSDDDVTISGSGSEDYSIAAGSDSFASLATIKEKVSSLYFDEVKTFIPTAGYYDVDSVTFTVKSSAIRNSKSGALFAEVYVGTVMDCWQKVYMVFDDVDDWSTGTSLEATATPGATVSGLSDFASQNPDYGVVTMSIDETGSSQEVKASKYAIEELLEELNYGRNTSYYSIDLTDEEGNAITSTGDSVLEICIPWTYKVTESVSVFRAHDDGDGVTATAFSKLSARTTSGAVDGTYYFDTTANKLYIYSSKYSVFGIHTEEVSLEDDSDSSDTDTSSGSSDSGSTSEQSTTTTYTLPVTMMKADDFSSVSMCNSLFYNYALMTISGNKATMTIYVIDPIPNYQAYGTPISEIQVLYGSNSVNGVLNSANALNLEFAADNTFIPTDGYYSADPITFTVPYSYVKASDQKTLMMSAYVNAVMESTQYFYLVFDTDQMVEGDQINPSVSDDLVDLTSIEQPSAVTTTSSTSSASAATVDTSTGSADNATIPGSYKVKVGAKKTNSDDTSMMEDYMYPYGDLVVASDHSELTIYIQHTVAGKDGGGPKYLNYNGVTATKVENAKTYDGIAYDAFTITTATPIPSILLVDMYINAMNMEVSCRLTVDLDSITGGSVDQVAASGTVKKSSGDPDEETEDEDESGDATTLTEDYTATSSGGGIFDWDDQGGSSAKAIFLIVVLSLIGLVVVGALGYYGYLTYKKRNTL